MAAGCGGQSTTAIPVASWTVPESFSGGKFTWTRMPELTKADEDLLNRFFRNQPQFTGSPELEGTPLVFHSGKSDRRFYWIRPGIEGPVWFCILFENNRLDTISGNGDPFSP